MADNEEVKVEGTFLTSLKRNAKQIREDRAQAIFEDTERLYRRKIEDIEDDIKKLRRVRENSIDLAPNNAVSTVVAPKDFDAAVFTETDIKRGIDIRNLEITLEIAKEQYKQLFGEGAK